MYDVFMYMFVCFAGRFSILFGSGHRTILTLHELLAVRFEDHLRALTSVSSHESVYDASLFVRAIVMSGACVVGADAGWGPGNHSYGLHAGAAFAHGASLQARTNAFHCERSVAL